MKKSLVVFLCIPLLWGCTSTLASLQSRDQDYSFEELKTEIADLKHALHGTDVELKLLEERLDQQESHQPKNDVAQLQRKLTLLEKSIEKINTDIHSLMTYANQTTSSLSYYDKKLEEVAKLRSTLTQISKTYSTLAPSSQTYRVKAGDSLEKVARKFQISVEALKRENQLTSDKIVIGQDLAIPHE